MSQEPIHSPGSLVERLTPAPFYVLKGALFLSRHKPLWKYAAAPLFISFVIMGIAYVLLYFGLGRMLGVLPSEEWYWRALYYVVVFVLTILMTVLFFFFFARVASALSAPFNELISQKTEELVTGNYTDTSFSVIRLIKDSSRAIAHSFKLLGLYLILLIACLFFLLIPGVGGFLFSACGWLLSAYMLAYEYLGYPMDRYRFSWNAKKKFLGTRLRTIIGFGLGNLIAASIPLVNLFFIPAAAIGGTLLFLELKGPEQPRSGIE
jgi:CysZ protein